MSLIDRFTRDAASKYIWAGLALAAAIGLAYSVSHGGVAVGEERAVAEGRAVGYVEGVLSPRLDSRELAAPISGQQAESLEAVVRRSILADERVSRVRIWSTEGTLLFSTDRSDRPGSNEGLNDPLLLLASRDGAFTRSDFSDGGGPEDPERSLLRTYVPIIRTAVAEIDQTDAGTIGAVRDEWTNYQFLAGGLLLWCLIMIALSLRDPIERLNVGVPFAASSVPRGFALIDDDRLAAVHEVYRLASERVGRLQEKLDESEDARRRLEGYIQQRLSKIGSDAPSPAVPAAAASPAQAPPAPAPAVVQVPESDVLPTVALDDALASAPAGPLARASRAQKPPPTASLQEKPAAEKPERVPKRPKAKPQQQTSAPREVSKTRTEPQPQPPIEPQPHMEPQPQPHMEPQPHTEPHPHGGVAASTPAAETWKQGAMKSGQGGIHNWHPLCDVLGCEHADAPAGKEEIANSRSRPKRSRRQAASIPATAPAKVPASAPVPAKRPSSKAPVSSRKGAAVPAPQPDASSGSGGSEVDDAKAHAAALETFIRLTESDRQHHDTDTDTVDQGEIRAALARTAARKKPGGAGLHPHEVPPEESLGGPPESGGSA